MPSDQLNHMLKFFMVLTISTVVISCNFNQDTYPLEKLILSNIEECQDYKFPTDSKEYIPENKVPEGKHENSIILDYVYRQKIFV